MKKTEIERIIKQGSMKQKIKLYFTDLAYFNTIGINSSSIVEDGDTTRLETPDQILTAKEKDIIYQSIKDPKDIKYYENLRSWNKAFLMFKPNITLFTKDFKYITARLSESVGIASHSLAMGETINDLIELIEDKELREKLIEKAIESLQENTGFTATRYQEEGYLPFIQLSEDNMKEEIKLLVEILNVKMSSGKSYINTLRSYLDTCLPLQPYREFLRKEEESIKASIEKCKELIDVFITGISLEEDLIKEEGLYLLTWEEVEVEVVDEDIEDIKSAGI